MRTLDDALEQFAYHPATGDTAAQHSALRDVLSSALEDIWTIVPDGPEKTLAIRGLQTAGFWGNLAIAMQAPADTSATRAIARVLPVTAVEPAPSSPECAGGGCGTCSPHPDEPAVDLLPWRGPR